jgi:hypothetical protein
MGESQEHISSGELLLFNSCFCGGYSELFNLAGRILK